MMTPLLAQKNPTKSEHTAIQHAYLLYYMSYITIHVSTTFIMNLTQFNFMATQPFLSCSTVPFGPRYYIYLTLKFIYIYTTFIIYLA